MRFTIRGLTAFRVIRPLRGATDLGLNFEHVTIPYQGGITDKPEFLEHHPGGHIPLVVDRQTGAKGKEKVRCLAGF